MFVLHLVSRGPTIPLTPTCVSSTAYLEWASWRRNHHKAHLKLDRTCRLTWHAAVPVPVRPGQPQPTRSTTGTQASMPQGHTQRACRPQGRRPYKWPSSLGEPHVRQHGPLRGRRVVRPPPSAGSVPACGGHKRSQYRTWHTSRVCMPRAGTQRACRPGQPQPGRRREPQASVRGSRAMPEPGTHTGTARPSKRPQSRSGTSSEHLLQV